MPDESDKTVDEQDDEADATGLDDPEPRGRATGAESAPDAARSAGIADDDDDNPEKTPYENLLRREPYDFARCTVTLTLQLLPEDGDPAGRPVVLGVQDHGFAPSLRFTRLSALALPDALTGALETHAQGMGEREQAYRAEVEAAQKLKAETEARRSARKTAPKTVKQKPKKAKVTDLPAPTPPAQPRQPVATTAAAASDKLQQTSLFGE